MDAHDTTPDPTPEQWAALHRLQARIRRMWIGVTNVRVGTAAIGLELAAKRKPGKVRTRKAREMFQMLTQCQRDALAVPGLADEPEVSDSLARLPKLIDAALDLA